MISDDLPAVIDLADDVHADYPEADEIFEERPRLFADGCLVLDDGRNISGYLLSHPWRYLDPPPLDSLLGAIPDAPSTYYIHDLALAASARGTGAGRAAVDHAARVATNLQLANMSLIAVGRSAPFWQATGFKTLDRPELGVKLASYDAAAAFMVRELSSASA